MIFLVTFLETYSEAHVRGVQAHVDRIYAMSLSCRLKRQLAARLWKLTCQCSISVGPAMGREPKRH